jgi:multidrug transporter EmrE-like cation transporter
MQVSPLIGGTILSVVESIGDFALKKYALGGSLGLLGVGFSIYGVLVGVLVWLLRTHGLAITNSYWDGTSNILSMIVGGFFLKEVYTVRQWMGMSVVVLGLFLLGS